MRSMTLRRTGWCLVLVVCLLAAAALLLLDPRIGVAVALISAAFALWERTRTEAAIRRLCDQLALAETATKLEVRDDRWAELKRALNRLLQQQRTLQRMQALVPTLPRAAVEELFSDDLPRDGLPRSIAVLALGTEPRNATDAVGKLDQLCKLARRAEQIASTHTALLSRAGDCIVLTFGAFEGDSPAVTLTRALEAAQAISAGDDAPSTSLALASGRALAVLLPGLGYSIVGEPIEQALYLQRLAAGRNDGALLCNESAYIALRRLGGAVALRPAEFLAQSVYALQLQPIANRKT